MTYPMLLGHCPVISLFPGPGVKAPASDSENLEAATAKVWPLELPTGQEPGMALELGTERAQGHPPAAVTSLGTEYSPAG